MAEPGPGADHGRLPRGTTPAEHERARLAWSRRCVLFGIALGLVGAVWTAIAGAGGAVGFALLAIGTAFGAALGGVVTGVLAVVDELQGRRVPRRRIVVALGLLAGSMVLVGIGTGALV